MYCRMYRIAVVHSAARGPRGASDRDASGPDVRLEAGIAENGKPDTCGPTSATSTSRGKSGRTTE